MSKFKKGESGNPAGRPKGIKDKRILFANMLNEHKEDLFNMGLNLALAGNENMLKIFLERLLPAKPRDEIIEGVDLTGTLEEKTNNVLSALSEGTITPFEANTIFAALVKRVALVNMVELESRVEELREHIKPNKKRDY